MSEKDGEMSVGTGLAVFAVAAPVAGVVRAWVIVCLWLWFAVPLGLPVLGFGHAYGLHLLWSMLGAMPANTDNDKGVTAALGGLIGRAILAPLVVLFFGWLVHSCGGAA